MNRIVFFDNIKELGPFNKSQVEGFDVILDEYQRRNTSLAFMAYILATAWWETAKTMKPVKEAFYVKNAEAWRKKNLRYWPYYGRGLIQLTWEYNYRLASKKYGVDFIKYPDLVMDLKYAIPIIFDGMIEGWFTTKRLDDYIDDIDESDDEDLREYTNARRVVNGTDKAVTIGKLALLFEKALREAEKVFLPIPTSPQKTTTSWLDAIKFLLGLFNVRSN